MIVRITGVLESLDGSRAVLAPAAGGLAYEALLPRFLAEDLADRIGQTVTLHTLQHLESQSQGASFTPRLLAFATPDDRRFFELFTTVKGVGAKKALRAMAAPVATIARAIAERDLPALQRLPEIGRRLAETVCAELHGKVEPYLAGGASNVVAEGKPRIAGAAEQAVAALVTLGETPADAERMVRRAISSDSELESPDAILSVAYALRG